jgi:hypothetical protein
MAPILWPNGLDEIKRTYGDPRSFLMGDGLTVSPEWSGSILVPLALPAPLPLSWDMATTVKRIKCHLLVASSLGSILARTHDAGLWPKVASFGGCYNWRLQRGGGKISTHGWAIAIDLGTPKFPQCVPLGVAGDMDPAIVECFGAEGATWGGHWSRRDDSHFQFCSGY